MHKMFSCPFVLCTYVTLDYNRMLKHIWQVHSLLPNFSVTCGISSCRKKYGNEQSFRRHIKVAHSTFYTKFLKYGRVSSVHHNSISNNLEGDEGCSFWDGPNYDVNAGGNSLDFSNNDHVCDETNYTDIVADLLIDFRETFHISQTAVSYICEKINNIISIDRNDHKNQILCSLSHNNIDITYDIKAILNCDSPFKRPFERFNSGSTLNNFISCKKEYVAPCEVVLDFNPVSGKKESMYYIPILKTLDAVICHEDVFGEILSCSEEPPDDLRNFKDGLCFSENTLYQQHKNALQVIFYHDDFQTSNPLGNKTHKFKISGFYFALGNLKPKHRSRLKDIHLTILCEAAFIKTYNYKTILRPLIDDLKILEDDGIEILFDNSTHKFFGTISMTVADNLAAHAIGCYYQNFSTVQRFCRFCNCSKSSLHTYSPENITIRSKAAYDAQSTEVELDPTLSKLYGVTGKSCLNELRYYHVTDGLPGDLAHDVFEGFGNHLLVALTVRWIKNKRLTIDCINTRILQFPYADIDKNNKPQILKIKPLTQLKYKQTASEMWNLLRLFPLLIGDLIDKDDEYWHLYCLFLDILERLCAHSSNEPELLYLEHLIHNFFTDYCTLFPDESMKPKAHFITHYPMNTRKFGALVKTFRFEAKHSFLKNCMNGSKNWINVCKSIAEHHQQYMYLQYKQEFYLRSDELKTISSKEATVGSLSASAIDILSKIGFHLTLGVTECKAVVFDGQRYYCGDGVMLGFSNDEYKFGKIQSALIIHDEPYLCCNCLIVNQFDTHFHAYVVEESDSITIIRVRDLFDYHPLGIYQIHGCMYLLLKHFVTQNIFDDDFLN